APARAEGWTRRPFAWHRRRTGLRRGKRVGEAWTLSAGEMAARIRGGELGSEELVRACLERIAAREPEVEAWEWLEPEAALAVARARDGQPAAGPLHGVPVGIKDIIDTADMPTACGSPI